MRITTQLASLALALTTSLATAGGDGWTTDFEAAKKRASVEKKDLLVDFTGSDWCSWCIKLNDEVFKHDAFRKGVADKYVLVKIDYPTDKSKQSEATQKQNEALRKQYEIASYPSIILMNDQGRPFARTGYHPGGPEKYLAHLDNLRAKHIQREEALVAANKLSGTEKAEALVAVLKSLPEDQRIHYKGIVDQIAQLDPEDSTGYLAQKKYNEAKTKLESEVKQARRNKKPDTALVIIDKFIAEHKVEGEEKNEFITTKLQIKVGIMAQAGKIDQALTTVDTCIAENELEGEAKQRALYNKIVLLFQNKKYARAEQVIDTVIAIAPDSQQAKTAAQLKPVIAEEIKLAKEMEASSKSKASTPAHGQPGYVNGKD